MCRSCTVSQSVTWLRRNFQLFTWNKQSCWREKTFNTGKLFVSYALWVITIGIVHTTAAQRMPSSRLPDPVLWLFIRVMGGRPVFTRIAAVCWFLPVRCIKRAVISISQLLAFPRDVQQCVSGVAASRDFSVSFSFQSSLSDMGAAAHLLNMDQVLWITGLLHHDTHLDLSLYSALLAKCPKTFWWLSLL